MASLTILKTSELPCVEQGRIEGSVFKIAPLSEAEQFSKGGRNAG